MLFASNLLNYNFSWIYCQENKILEVEGISCSNSSLAKMLMALCLSLPLFHLISWVGLISSLAPMQQRIWSLDSYAYNSQGVNITPRNGLWLPGATWNGGKVEFSKLLKELFPEKEKDKMVLENGLLARVGVSRKICGQVLYWGRPINAAKSKCRQGLKNLMVLRTDLQKYPIRHILVTSVTKAKENYAKLWFLAWQSWCTSFLGLISCTEAFTRTHRAQKYSFLEENKLTEYGLIELWKPGEPCFRMLT